MDERQEILDRFYHSHGPCCAGCDWWAHLTSKIGECHRHAPTISGRERMEALGFSFCSQPMGPGHALTARDHHCGDFKDDFDWTSLPLPYRKSIGAAL